MFDKINVSEIIKGHLNTLIDDHTGNKLATDYIVFFGLPLIFSGVLTFLLPDSFSDDAVGILITTFSILLGLMLNLLVLVYDLLLRDKKPIVKKVLEQTFSNISFSILLSVTLILLLLLTLIDLSQFEWLKYPGLVSIVLNFVIFSFIGIFVMGLLMILKRVHALLSEAVKSTD